MCAELSKINEGVALSHDIEIRKCMFASAIRPVTGVR